MAYLINSIHPQLLKHRVGGHSLGQQSAAKGKERGLHGYSLIGVGVVSTRGVLGNGTRWCRVHCIKRSYPVPKNPRLTRDVEPLFCGFRASLAKGGSCDTAEARPMKVK